MKERLHSLRASFDSAFAAENFWWTAEAKVPEIKLTEMKGKVQSFEEFKKWELVQRDRIDKEYKDVIFKRFPFP